MMGQLVGHFVISLLSLASRVAPKPRGLEGWRNSCPVPARYPLLLLSALGLWRDTADRKIASREKTAPTRADRQVGWFLCRASVEGGGVDADDGGRVAVGAEQWKARRATINRPSSSTRMAT